MPDIQHVTINTSCIPEDGGSITVLTQNLLVGDDVIVKFTADVINNITISDEGGTRSVPISDIGADGTYSFHAYYPNISIEMTHEPSAATMASLNIAVTPPDAEANIKWLTDNFTSGSTCAFEIEYDAERYQVSEVNVVHSDGSENACSQGSGDSPSWYFIINNTVTGVKVKLQAIDTNAPTDKIVHLTEKQIQKMVTDIFEVVNTRITERIVQEMVANDTKHVPSADSVKKAVDEAMTAALAADGKAVANTALITELTSKVGEGTESVKTYTDEQISELRTALMGMNHWNIVPVTGTLPEELEADTIYLQRDSEDDTTWEMNILTSAGVVNVGRTDIDLSNYWSKDDINAMTKAVINESDPGDIFKMTNVASYKYAVMRLNNYLNNSSSVDPNGTIIDTLTAISGTINRGTVSINDLRTAANISYEDFNKIPTTNEKLTTAIRTISGTTNLAETYLAIATMKELLGITGDLTVESVQAAIETIAVNAVPAPVEPEAISDAKIDAIVANAISITAAELNIEL